MYRAHATNSALTFCTDTRRKSDQDLDEAEPSGAPHVLELNAEVKAAIATKYYTAQRLALFDHGASERATAAERAAERVKMREELLRGRHPQVAVVIPTSGFTETRDPQKAETICWGIFGAPDALANMRGCFFKWHDATGTRGARYVIPIHAYSPHMKELQKWENARWLNRAESFHRHLGHDPTATPLLPYNLVAGQNAGPNSFLVSALDVMLRGDRGIAIDIESIEATGTITAIGVSDGLYAVSVNWEPFAPHGSTRQEPGLLSDFPNIGTISYLMEQLIASDLPKVFHNHTFDVPRLEAKGLRVGGAIEDTFAASAIAHPELKHGLQAACARYIPEPIPPWKSLWHPKIPGVNRDDIEYWTCDPAALYDYNARDAFYTWHLAKAVLPQAGRSWVADKMPMYSTDFKRTLTGFKKERA